MSNPEHDGDGGLTPEEMEAAWLQAMADAYHEQLEADQDWSDDWMWFTGPGPGDDAGPRREEGGDR